MPSIRRASGKASGNNRSRGVHSNTRGHRSATSASHSRKATVENKVAAGHRQKSIDGVKVPSVTLHKSGRFVRMKPNDIYAADVVREIQGRIDQNYTKFSWMHKQSFYGIDGDKEIPSAEKKIEIWRWLQTGINTHPIMGILASYGVEVQIAPSLQNYMAKELKRQTLENTPYPTPPITTDVPLFDRCTEGTVLKCIKDYSTKANQSPTFKAGHRYMVMATGGEGRDVVTLSTHEMTSGASLSLVGSAARHEWTSFDAPMEEHFDDSESTDIGKDLTKLYKDRIKAMKKRLAAMNLPLRDHVAEDAAMMALYRGVMNAYPMRMGKTSCAIAVAELTGSQKILAVAPGNARLFWTKEFERMGFKMGEHFQEIRSLEEIDDPCKYHLITYTWLSLGKDPAYKARKNWENLLKPSTRTIKRQRQNITWKEMENVEVKLTNNCPHCKQALERPCKLPGGRYDCDQKGNIIWTTARGYICRNQKCEWKTDNRGINAAWGHKNLIKHVGGYINYDLAAHAGCEDERVKGRMCPECHVADATWQPPRYKRLKKLYSHVILDEIHATKDDTTDTSTAALNLRARRRQGLTGTPMSNSAMDLYWPLHWIVRAPTIGFPYSLRDGAKQFDSRFCDAVYLEKPVGTETNAQGQVVQLTKTVRKRVPFLKNPPEFWKFTAPRVRRRSYSDPLYQKALVSKGYSMPKTDIKKVACPMDPIQAALMLASIKDFKGTFDKLQKEAEKKGIQVNPTLVISQMTTMRTTATCPELLNEKFGSKVYTGPEGGGKIPYIRTIVEEKMQDDGKVLILSDFRRMQETVEKAVGHFGSIRFNTGWDDESRREAFTKFQEDKEARIFIAGTRAIREGVDLSAADTCICCDLLWSPAFQTQAWSRIMAPSTRERTCEVYLMLSANSLDEHIFNVFYSKMVAAEQAIDRKVLGRRAQTIDIKWFVQRVLEEERAISHYLRDADEDIMTVADLDLSEFEGRMV